MNQDKRPLYAKIEIGRKQLPEMDNDEFFYDTFLTDNFGNGNAIKSKTALSYAQLVRCVDLLAKAGAVFTSSGTNKKVQPHVRPDWMEIPDGMPYSAMKRQICQIWRKLGYSLTSLETRVQREFKVKTLLWLHDEEKLSILLTDLQKREKSFDAKQAESECKS